MASIEEIRKARLKKLDRIQRTGILAYPGEVRRNHTIEEALVPHLKETKDKL